MWDFGLRIADWGFGNQLISELVDYHLPFTVDYWLVDSFVYGS